MTQWKKVKIGDFLTESKILAEESDANHRITVRLNCKGVEKRSLKAEKEGATKYYERKAGQFIYGKQNIHKGAFGVIPKELDGFTSSADLPAFDIDKSKCIPEWLCLCLKVDERYKTLQKDVKGVGSQRLAVNIFLNVEIPLPNLMEQKRIVSEISEKLENIQQLSEEVEKQKSYAKQLRQNILQEAIEGKLTADWRKQHPVQKGNPDYDAEALFDKIHREKTNRLNSKELKKGALPKAPRSNREKLILPHGWCWAKIDDLYFVTKLAGFEFTEYFHLSEKGDIPVVRAQNVRKRYLEKTNLLYIDSATSKQLERSALTKQCLLVTFIGAGIGDVGLFDEPTRWHLAPNVAKVEPIAGCENYINNQLTNLFVLSEFGQSEIFKYMKATAQPSLSMESIRDIDFPLPPLAE